MKKATGWTLSTMIALTTLLLASADDAGAIPQFKKEWDAMYTDADSSDAAVQELTAAAKKAKCNVCHAGRSKKMRNPYGADLSMLLDKKEDKKDVEKIKEALKKVEAMHSVSGDDNSPTWGEVFASGQLPPQEEAGGK